MIKTNSNAVDEIIEDKALRDKYVDRLDVLDKVKALMMIPEMECITMRQVADYYEVDIDTVRKCYQRNEKEIEPDGVVIKTPRNFKELTNRTNCPFSSYQITKVKLIIKIDDNTTLEIPNRGITCFSKRAVLRFGMLLRDSAVAQEVRTQLLNVTEHAVSEKPEIVTREIDKEQMLLLKIGEAYGSGDFNKFAQASMEYNQYIRRNQERIENENKDLRTSNKMLSGEILTITNRSKFTRVIRVLATWLHMNFGQIYNLFYDQLLYLYGINLRRRGERKAPFVQYIKDDEWEKVDKTINAILQDNNINPCEFYEACDIRINKKDDDNEK